MSTLKNKLLDYGFNMEQVETILKRKKLNTSHGTYTLNSNNTMTLKQETGKKEIKL